MKKMKIELIDLGDAIEETKQCAPLAFLPDSWFQWGTHAWPTPPDQCPRVVGVPEQA